MLIRSRSRQSDLIKPNETRELDVSWPHSICSVSTMETLKSTATTGIIAAAGVLPSGVIAPHAPEGWLSYQVVEQPVSDEDEKA